MVSAVILSATRLIDDEGNLRRIVEVLHSARVPDIVIVRNEDQKDLMLPEAFKAIVVTKTKTDGELSSLISGLDSSHHTELHGVLLLPSDQERISQAIVVTLLHQFWISHAGIVIAAYDGVRDFPLILAESLFANLRQRQTDSSLASFIDANDSEIKLVEFDKQDNIIRDV